MKKIFFLLLVSSILLLLGYSDDKSKNDIKSNNNFDTVKIGNQVWMKRNLDVTTYRNGDVIPEVKDPKEWTNLYTGAWCYYNNDPAMGKFYGKLYNWYAVNDRRGLAPKGWHIPSNKEWSELINWAGGFSKAGGILKNALGWETPNTAATNASGFTALPGGLLDANTSTFTMIIYTGWWWSSSESDDSNAWYMRLLYSGADIFTNPGGKHSGFSVRCVRD